MLSVKNPSTPDIFTHEKTGQRFAIYLVRATKKYTSWFYVNDYKHPQRRLKSFNTRKECIEFSSRVCDLLSLQDIGKTQVLIELANKVIEKPIQLSERQKFLSKVSKIIQDFPNYMFWTSHSVISKLGLEDNLEEYDKVYRAVSTITHNQDKYGVNVEYFGYSSKYSLGGQRKRPSKLFRTLEPIA